VITPEVLARFIATELGDQAQNGPDPYSGGYVDAEHSGSGTGTLDDATLDGHFDLMKLSTKIIGLGIWDAVSSQLGIDLGGDTAFYQDLRKDLQDPEFTRDFVRHMREVKAQQSESDEPFPVGTEVVDPAVTFKGWIGVGTVVSIGTDIQGLKVYVISNRRPDHRAWRVVVAPAHRLRKADL